MAKFDAYEVHEVVVISSDDINELVSGDELVFERKLETMANHVIQTLGKIHTTDSAGDGSVAENSVTTQ